MSQFLLSVHKRIPTELWVVKKWAKLTVIKAFHSLFFCSGVYSPDYDNCDNVQYVNKQPRRLGKGDCWVWPRFEPLTPSP